MKSEGRRGRGFIRSPLRDCCFDEEDDGEEEEGDEDDGLQSFEEEMCGETSSPRSFLSLFIFRAFSTICVLVGEEEDDVEGLGGEGGEGGSDVVLWCGVRWRVPVEADRQRPLLGGGERAARGGEGGLGGESTRSDGEAAAAAVGGLAGG